MVEAVLSAAGPGTAGGWGVPKSPVKARSFWAKACKTGGQKACGKQQ
ncbi:MAG: hypothetical protein IPQ09_12275 [Myxococcales bacterium]|jgi:hypothetical protein|nr:hypothetical protein [Myxococcales bacterium]